MFHEKELLVFLIPFITSIGRCSSSVLNLPFLMFYSVMVALEVLVLSVIVRIGVERVPLPPSPALSFLPRFCAGLFFFQAVSTRHSFFISRSLLYPVPQPVPKKGGRRKGNYAVRRNQAPLRKGVHRFRRTCSLRTSPKSLEGQRAALLPATSVPAFSVPRQVVPAPRGSRCSRAQTCSPR